MGYIKKHLMDDEKIICIAPIHWAIYISGFSLIAIGLLMFFLLGNRSLELNIGNVAGGVVIFIGVIDLFKSWIFKISTELSVQIDKLLKSQLSLG